VMAFVNCVSRAELNAEGRIVEQARKRNIGMVGMKVLGGSGQLADDYDRSLRYTLSVPGVHCAIVGVKNADEVRRAVRAAKEFRPLTDAEMKEAIRWGRETALSDSHKAALLREHNAADLGATA
jgi:hypothetical protein